MNQLNDCDRLRPLGLSHTIVLNIASNIGEVLRTLVWVMRISE